jgi:hypothetical protein
VPSPSGAAAAVAAEPEAAADDDVAEEIAERERDRERRGTRERERSTSGATDAETRIRERQRERERQRDREPDRAREPDRDRDRARDEDTREAAPVSRDRGALSPAAQAALRRRRILAAVAGLVVVLALGLGVAALAGAFSSDDNGSDSSSSGSDTTSTTPTTGTTGTTPANGQQPEVLGQIPLKAVNGAKAKGVAYLLRQGGQQVLAVTATLPPLPASQREAAYNVWLYNSPDDAASIGAQFTNAKGEYQGVGPLPAEFDKYKFIDVSRQPFNKQTGHSGDSLLRGELADLQPVPQGQGPAGGTPTTPSGP